MAPSAPVHAGEAAQIFAGFDALGTGVAVWSGEAVLLFANRAFRRCFGFATPEGMAFSAFLAEVAASKEWRLPRDADGWAAGEAAAFGLESETDYALADGRTLRMTLAPAGGGCVTLTLADVTAPLRREAALRAAKEQAEATDEAKSRFLRAANHDLRQPLSSLKIMIYNCIREQDEARRGELLHAMDVSASVMEDLLGALLQIGQLDAGRITPRVSTFQLSQLFERLDIQFRHQAADKGLRLRIVGARAAVTTDRALLERILSNLVANAVRFTDVGGVLVGCRRRGDALRIDVVDTGRGVAPEDEDRIFEEFYRAPDNRRLQKSGLGLGLNIVKRLASLLDHPVELRSRPGAGSRFSVAVPVGDVRRSEVAGAEVNEAVAGEFAGVPTLFVEDDDVLRHSMGQLLERWGVQQRAAATAEEAMEIVASGFRPRLILADYSIRERTGLDVIAAVRRAVGSEVAACIITADAEPEVVERVRQARVPLLVKPVSPPRLRVMMHTLLFEPEPR